MELTRNCTKHENLYLQNGQSADRCMSHGALTNEHHVTDIEHRVAFLVQHVCVCVCDGNKADSLFTSCSVNIYMLRRT